MTILKSILAILAGIVFIVGASTLTDLVLCKTLFPEMATTHARPAVLALALGYRCLFGVVGGWMTAKLAPSKPMIHALVLGGIGTAAALAGLVAMWSVGAQWYPLALVALALPQCWLGAKIEVWAAV